VEPSNCEQAHQTHRQPEEALSHDPEVLRVALIRERAERRRADGLAKMHMDVVKLALDLLVRDPDIESFFGGLTKNMVEESDSHVCAVWLIDEAQQRCDMWMAYVVDRLYTQNSADWKSLTFPHEVLGSHLFAYAPGWSQTVEYQNDDPRLPDAVREFHRRAGVHGMVIAPLILGTRTLGWIKLSSRGIPECEEAQWWRVVLIEAIARQAALALHHSRLAGQNRLEERRKTILEERNRLARDIHDNLAQGFAAILMQLQAAQRESCRLAPAVAVKLETAVDLARMHMIEARRSVGTLRPNVSDGEDVAHALKRIADLARRTTSVPIEVSVDELPRFGDGPRPPHHAPGVHGAIDRLSIVGRRRRPRDCAGAARRGIRDDQHAGACRAHRRVAHDRDGAAQRHRSRARVGTVVVAHAGPRCQLKVRPERYSRD